MQHFSRPRTNFAHRRFLIAFGGIALCFAAGCGQDRLNMPTGTVSGKITVAGKPLEKGRVNFTADKGGFGASGTVKPDGAYSLEGPIPTGGYKVFITFELAPSERSKPEAQALLKSVPQKYQSLEKSDLKALVKENQNQFDFDLK